MTARRSGDSKGTPDDSVSSTNLSIEEKRTQLLNGYIPRHIAFIMDGNGRWAKKRKKFRITGHKQGLETAKNIIELCKDIEGIDCITLYAFSTENWKRPKTEIKGLMMLLRYFLRRETSEMIKNGIRFRTIGALGEFPGFVQEELDKATHATRDCDAFTLNVALNYGSRSEIISAALELNNRIDSGEITPDKVDESYFSKLLYTSDLPDPDLLVRTSGEVRVSNFLLWQIAYSEIYVTPTLWPDFDESELLDAILDYQKRERRFGGLQKKGRKKSGKVTPARSG